MTVRDLSAEEKTIAVAMLLAPLDSWLRDGDIRGYLTALYPHSWVEQLPPIDAAMQMLFLHGWVEVLAGKQRLTLKGVWEIGANVLRLMEEDDQWLKSLDSYAPFAGTAGGSAGIGNDGGSIPPLPHRSGYGSRTVASIRVEGQTDSAEAPPPASSTIPPARGLRNSLGLTLTSLGLLIMDSDYFAAYLEGLAARVRGD